jgi:hypothetical protein
MLLIDIRSTNASAAEFILYRLKLYLAGRHHHHRSQIKPALGSFGEHFTN